MVHSGELQRGDNPVEAARVFVPFLKIYRGSIVALYIRKKNGRTFLRSFFFRTKLSDFQDCRDIFLFNFVYDDMLSGFEVEKVVKN